MLSRLVITFFPRRKHLLISWLQSPSAVILKPPPPPKKNLTLFPLFPHLFPMTWWDRMPWSSFSECWALGQLFHSSFTFIKRLFSSSSVSAIRVVSSAYLRFLIFLLPILIPACVSSSPAFLMMYSACKLSKQGDNIQPSQDVFEFSLVLLWDRLESEVYLSSDLYKSPLWLMKHIHVFSTSGLAPVLNTSQYIIILRRSVRCYFCSSQRYWEMITGISGESSIYDF